MKTFFAFLVLAVSAGVYAAEKPVPAEPPAVAVKGEILEIVDAESFTYFRLKTKDGEIWSAVARAPLKVGSQVTVENVVPMKDFKSKSLNRTFPLIYLGNLPRGAGSAPAAAGMPAGHAGAAKPPVETANIKVPKATGANARTVAEILAKGAELKDKPVLVRGRIVKYNQGIMGRNWIHLRDGSGSEADGTNDILVTTSATAQLGDIVTAKGVVHTDKDFGSGYAYKVLIEDATLQK
jgi:hypothetical protein